MSKMLFYEARLHQREVEGKREKRTHIYIYLILMHFGEKAPERSKWGNFLCCSFYLQV